MTRRAAVVILLVLLTTAGCKRHEADAPEGADAGRPADDATIRLWHIYGEGEAAGGRERAVLDAAVRRFEAAHPGVKVKTESFANDDYKVKLNIEMAGGNPPDVFFTWGGGPLAELARAGRVADLTDALDKDGWRERILPAPLGLCMADGRAYAVPLDLSCVPLWYNAALFEANQLQPPTTFEEMMTLCATFRAKGVTPLALGNRKQWPGAFYFIYLAARAGGTQLFLDAAARKPGKTFDDPAFVSAGNRLIEMVKADTFSKGFNGMVHDHARTQFFEGQAAMYLMGSWLVARAQEQPGFLANLKCAPFPTVPGGKGDPTTMVGGVNCAFAVSSACAARDEAIALARFLTDEETAKGWSALGRIPAVKTSPEALAALPAPTRAALELLEKAASLQPYYDQYLPPHLAAEHKKTTQELFALTLSAEEAAARMERCAQEKR